MPPLIMKLSACRSYDEAQALLRPHVVALGVRDADAIVVLELARWMTHHMMGHLLTGKIHALLCTSPSRHDVGYYLDDPREPLKLRRVR